MNILSPSKNIHLQYMYWEHPKSIFFLNVWKYIVHVPSEMGDEKMYLFHVFFIPVNVILYME